MQQNNTTTQHGGYTKPSTQFKRTMTLSYAHKVALNKIIIFNSSPIKSYNLAGHLLFNFVFFEETNYINFILLKPYPDDEIFEPVRDFVKLITKIEYVSLTFNEFLIDYSNNKLIFKPKILPNFIYEFDLIDQDINKFQQILKYSIYKLNDNLSLNYLNLNKLDYILIDNGNYERALNQISDEVEV